MALQDHVAILLSASLDRPAPNKRKPHLAPRYYIRAAVPPDAGADLGDAMAQVAPGGNWQATAHGIKRNEVLKKPYLGVPADWLIIKLDTQFPVPVYDEQGREIPVSAENAARIRSQFFAGQRIRIEGSPYSWLYEGEQGISWNLWGALAVGGGERLPGSGGEGFSKYRPDDAQPPATSGGFGTNTPQNNGQQAQGNPSGNAFGGQQASSGQQAGSGGAAGGNPFQQASGGARNPFG